MVGSKDKPTKWKPEEPLDEKIHSSEHGTATAYNLGCRCQVCKDAHNRRLTRHRRHNAKHKIQINAANRARTRLVNNHKKEYDAILREELDGAQA
jgi:hypothetical protein